MLRLTNVAVDYRRGIRTTRALDVSGLDVDTGTVFGLVGESGSGKTTLARAVAGLVSLSSGTIELDGDAISDYSGRQRRRFRASGRVMYVHQDTLGSLDPDWTVRRSLLEPLATGPGRSRLPRAQIDLQLETVLNQLNLDAAMLSRYPGQLSGGQRQRACLARALIRNPTLLILDEPTSALDSVNKSSVLEVLRGLRSSGITVLVISHDIGSLAGLVDRIGVMYRGRIVEQDVADQIVLSPSHPYTRLLMASVPSLFGPGITPTERRALRAEVERLEQGAPELTPLPEAEASRTP
jgi:ABC-type glutathione transport system ATPase component